MEALSWRLEKFLQELFVKNLLSEKFIFCYMRYLEEHNLYHCVIVFCAAGYILNEVIKHQHSYRFALNL